MTDAEQMRPGPFRAQESPEQQETREIDRWMYQFTAQLAHDMRAPMGAIFMWAHVLRATDGGGENRAAIDAIEASARHQSRMLADVVDMARALVGRLPVDRVPAQLPPVVSAAIEEKSKDAAIRRVTVEWSEDQAGDLGGWMVKMDAKRLQQALSCLVLHALASTQGSGRVTVRLARRPATRDAELRISLPAGGMEPAALEDVFQAYHAGGLDLTAARPDFGMGLPFARAVVRLHGGTLEVENQGPGGPLEFVVQLPLAEGAAG